MQTSNRERDLGESIGTMKRRRVALIVGGAVVFALLAAAGTAQAVKPGGTTMGSVPRSMAMSAAEMITARTTPAMRQDAAARAAAKRSSLGARVSSGLQALFTRGSVVATFNPQGKPDYFGTTPNWANSPLPESNGTGGIIPGTGIRKFVDSLPGLGFANRNNLGQYLTVATADTTSFPGSDYYIIALVEYSEKLHSDLPPTKLRGYVQLNSAGQQMSAPSYLGPTILAQRDRPTRVKFINKLPTGAGGDLFIPTDTTAMGAGFGPDGVTPYTQNRATLHLHGGATPWISDGTPHQWTTPAGESTKYPKGVSVYNVPDMPDPGPGALTFSTRTSRVLA